MNKPKVYFLASAYQTCDLVRCYMPLLHCGYNGSQVSLYSEIKDNVTVAKEINEADIIVFHRPDTISHHKAAIAMREAGKIIVFDNDDTAYLDRGHPFDYIDDAEFVEKAPIYRNIIDNFILNADAVTTTTEFLAQEYRKNNDKVVVLPNCIDPEDWDEPLRNETDKVRILISGSAAYTLDFRHIADYMRELDARDDVQLIMFGLWSGEKRKKNPEIERTYHKEYKFWDSLKNLEHREWAEIEEYPRILNETRADIQIIPRYESYFNKCKSNLKFLESSMAGVPCIVQSFSTLDSPYDSLPDDVCIKADSVVEWKQAVEKLIADKELRRNMAKKAKDFVLENFNIEKNHYMWTDFYQSLFNQINENHGETKRRKIPGN